jgi:hypothetical protein
VLNNRNARVATVLVLLAFAFGMMKLFELRYRSGEVYPAYSTLRTDPKGCKALYEGLASMPEYTVEQNLKPLSFLHSTSNATVFLQGTSMLRLFALIKQEHKSLTQLLANNNRVVLTFPPSQRGSRGWQLKDDPDMKDPAARKLLKKVRETRHKKERGKLRKWLGDEPAEPNTDEEAEDEATVELEDAELDSELVIDEQLADEFIDTIQTFIDFGLIEFKPLPESPEARRATIRDPEIIRQGEQDIPWNSTMVFGQVSRSWNILAERDDYPVILEGSVSGTNGSVVVCSDSYFLSNEAMLSNQRPAFLMHLLGNNTHIIFDETHLGISRKPGIANLAGRYHLHGLVAGLGLLAALFIWRNSTSLIPLPDTAAHTHTIEGKDHAAGMINLLRRNIGANKLYDTCLKTWLGQRLNSVHGSRRERVVQFAEDPTHKDAGKKQPLQTYKEFQHEINRRR